jgi:hypothetical protein
MTKSLLQSRFTKSQPSSATILRAVRHSRYGNDFIHIGGSSEWHQRCGSRSWLSIHLTLAFYGFFWLSIHFYSLLSAFPRFCNFTRIIADDCMVVVLLLLLSFTKSTSKPNYYYYYYHCYCYCYCCQVASVKCQVSSVKCQVSSVKFQVSEFDDLGERAN